ncbi:hypothetical protein A8B78_16365 [Jannaschia sp. EhC01]|nr:hypothetical protein A8B78_16365 [Jannaschia sp. EhC01]
MDTPPPRKNAELNLSEACTILSAAVTPKPGPVVLHQYWDHDPPRQIAKLLKHNARHCRRFGMGHEIWTKERAKHFLHAHLPDQLDLFLRAPHPAMASDLLRLCLIEVHGGIYLDADMGLNPDGGKQLPSLLHQALLFKWEHDDRQNAPNWCFGFRKGHPMIRHIREETARSMTRAINQDPDTAMKTILNVSGPGRFTKAAASWIATHGCPPGLLMLDVTQTGSLVLNGPVILGRQLEYKQTAKHWLIAAGKAPGS